MSAEEKRSFISRFKIPILIVLALFAYEGSYIYTLPPLARELYFHKTLKGALVIDATGVISPHFIVGQPQEEAFAYLERQGFKIYAMKNTNPKYYEQYKNTHTGVFPLRASFNRIILTSYTAAVNLQFDDNGRLIRAYGNITMNHL